MPDLLGIDYLRKKLALKAVRVLTRYKYYEGKQGMTRDSIVMPDRLRGMYRSVTGWCSLAVDQLADRLDFQGFDEASDLYDVQAVFDLNNPDVLFPSLITESMIGACAFAHISHGDNGERIPKISSLTAFDATGVIDEFTGLLKEGYAVLDRDVTKQPSLEAYFTAEATEYYQDGKLVRVEDNPALYPLLVPVAYRPTAKRPFGHSRISRAAMYYTQYAMSTLQRSEVGAEFYAFPQKYAVGTDPEADPLDTWRATISAMLRFDKDQDGDSPKLGQFTQLTMQPHLDQLRTAASMFAGETGLTLDDLGFPSDNPSSAEAIKASHDSLRVVARKAQRTYRSAFANIGFLAASVRDGRPYKRDLIPDMRAVWAPVFEPDASTLSIVGDGAAKINRAVPGYLGAKNLRDLTGIEGDEGGMEEAANNAEEAAEETA
jgi:hypothetical protein